MPYSQRLPEKRRDREEWEAKIYGEVKEGIDIPITTPPTLAAISPNLGSMICFDRNVRIGSNATSSRPLSATRSPSRWINSWIRANDIDGRTVCSSALSLYIAEINQTSQTGLDHH